MRYILTRKFIEGSLAGMTISQESSVDLADFVGKILGGGHLGPKYILVSCLVKDVK